ncbi:MAG: hypothetical protein ACR2RE_24985 [Geminicoccaceae bacterium]
MKNIEDHPSVDQTKRPDDWRPKGPFRYWRADFLRDTRMLSAGDKWRYFDLLACMWENGGWVHEEELKDIWGTKWRRFGSILSTFCRQNGQRWTQNRIQHDLDKQWGNADRQARHRAGSNAGSNAPSPSPSYKKERKKEKTYAHLENSQDRFSEWWKCYPRKKGKGQAERAYRSALKKISHDELVEKTKSFAAGLNGSDPQYTPYPATWLNGERWSDDVDRPAAPTSGFEWIT